MLRTLVACMLGDRMAIATSLELSHHPFLLNYIQVLSKDKMESNHGKYSLTTYCIYVTHIGTCVHVHTHSHVLRRADRRAEIQGHIQIHSQFEPDLGI